MSDTNAVKWLRAQGVVFRALEYQFTENGPDHAAEAVGRRGRRPPRAKKRESPSSPHSDPPS